MVQRPQQWTALRLAGAIGVLSLAGCARPRATVFNYQGKVISAAWVPGQPDRFRVRLRLRRIDGQPMNGNLPEVRLDIPQPPNLAYWATSSSRITLSPDRRACDVVIGGRHLQPPTTPLTVGVVLQERRRVPRWKRFLAGPGVTHEVTAQWAIGSFVLPPAAPPPGGAAGTRAGALPTR
jgi:hypothetical protein